MLEVNNVKVYGLAESIIRSGYAMDTGELIDNFDYHVKCVDDYINERVQYSEDGMVAKNHIKRAKKLFNAKAGSGHDSALKGVRVEFDLKYPEYISPQLQRYNWFDITTSQSKMHRLTKMDIRKSTNEYVDDVVIKNLEYWIEIFNNWEFERVYINTDGYYTFIEDDYDIKGIGKMYSKYEVFMKIISNCPSGLEKWMGISTNYMQLSTILRQRETHKLKEDYGVLCRFIRELPMFKELCSKNG